MQQESFSRNRSVITPGGAAFGPLGGIDNLVCSAWLIDNLFVCGPWRGGLTGRAEQTVVCSAVYFGTKARASEFMQ
jgi:hypothetical protein